MSGIMSQLQPIETLYNGYRFRSLLEARWAVFFDHCGLRYEYEPEGFDLDGIWYLPDFYIPSLKQYFEVKPNKTHLDDTMQRALLGQAAYRVPRGVGMIDRRIG